MANVDLVDLVPILKAINNIKNEYKEALQTSETDFSLYPVLTENFIDESYNQGYEIGYKQAWMDYLGTTEVDVLLPREMRELVPATYTSQSGDATYDTLTSIMNFCLSVRRNLKTILDLDSDLFELYPPRLIEVAGSQYVAGTNDGYVQGVTAISSLSITAPKIEQINNSVFIHTQFPGATTYYTVGTGGEFIPYVDGTEIPVPEDSTIIVYAYSNAGTKNSEVVSDEFTYTSFLQPTITFEDNIAMIYSNYSLDENVTTMYRLSSWEDYQEFIEYDGIPIPINSTTLVEAYNVFEDGSTSSTTQRVCTPVDVPVAETPLTPVVTFSDSTNTLTITCATNGATIYYKKEGSTLGWIQYTSPIKLVESGTYSAISVLNGVESAPSEPVVCTVASGGGTGIILPPTIICNNNKVTVFTSQSGVTLKVIRLDYGYVDSANDIPFDSWVTYDGPFDISQDGKYQAKAILNSDTTKEALSVECQCKYYSTPSGSGSTSGGGEGSTDIPYIAPPIIYYTNHVVSMTAVTAGSSIKYKTAWEDTWHDYTTPITITESAVFQAKAVKDGNESTVTELACKVEDEGIWMCYMDFSYDTLTVTTNVSGGNILVKRANDTWEEYSGPISITQSDWWYAKVEREGLESEVFSLWCEYSNTDYSTLQFTIVLEQDGYIKIHSIGSGTQPNYDTSYFAYLNGFGRWSQLRYGMFWKANTPLLIEASIPASKSNGRRYTIRTGVNYVVYGNAATLIRESDRENLPSNVVLTLGEECTSHAGLSLPETWYLDVEHDYAPSAPTIVFDSNTNTVVVNKASDSPDSFLQYKIDDGEWLDYIYPFVISSNCTIYAKAYNTGRYSTNWSEEASLECEINEEVPVIEDCKISEPELGIVNIICSTPNVDIYYKLKNEEDWTKYTGTLHLDSPDELTVRPQLDFNGTTIYGNTIIKPVCDPSYVPYVYASCHSNIVTIIRTSGQVEVLYKKTTDSEWITSWGDSIRLTITESCTYQIKGHHLNSNVYNEFELECIYEVEEYYNQPFTIELIERDSYIRIPFFNNTLATQSGGLYYKVNNGNWTKVNSVDTFNQRFNLYDKVSFKGQDTHDISITGTIEVYDIINEQRTNTKFKAYGNICSIKFNTSGGNPVPLNYYQELFMNSYITDASNLYFYARDWDGLRFDKLFKNCIYLTQTPNLDGLYNWNPNDQFKSNDYTEMFSGCTSLIITPKLFDIRGGFEKMFEGCTSLTTISNLPMFIGRSGSGSNIYTCREMFSGCTSLVNTPLIIYIDVNQYGRDSFDLNQMFEGCTSLTRTLHLVWRGVGTNTGTIGFTRIFSNCSNINYIKQLQYILGRYVPMDWVSGVSATGTFVKKSGVTWQYGIPTGWTVIEV